METTTMITKLTGQTVIALPSCASASFGTAGITSAASLLRGAAVLADNGLGLDGQDLDTTGVSVIAAVLGVSGLGNTGAGSVEAGLSGNWPTFGGGRELRNERPIQAPKAVAAAAEHGDYAQAIGAGEAKKQDEQQIAKAEAAFMGAMAVRIRAYRGPQPWRERT
ncbi:hypothetical protein GCM10009760_05370 [Kitasatospora kazusensis]|uniref:Uncharacterized protein n=1 Tax=Kitasatospora kazusensis TaxID=407974 RepID=A0ABP5KIR0_9ACTN